jgi:hypothetical protein
MEHGLRRHRASGTLSGWATAPRPCLRANRKYQSTFHVCRYRVAMHRPCGSRRSIDLSSGRRLRRQRRPAIRRAISLGSQSSFGNCHGNGVSARRAEGGPIQHRHTDAAGAAIVGASSRLRGTFVLAFARDVRSVNERSSTDGVPGSPWRRCGSHYFGRFFHSEAIFRNNSDSRRRETHSRWTTPAGTTRYARWSHGRACGRPTSPRNTSR